MNAKTNEKQMSRGTRKALEASIKHWEHAEITLAMNPDDRDANPEMIRPGCALCMRFKKNCMRRSFFKPWGTKELCPVMLRTKERYCEGSPYRRYPNLEDCEKEIKFLVSLRPEMENDQ